MISGTLQISNTTGQLKEYDSEFGQNVIDLYSNMVVNEKGEGSKPEGLDLKSPLIQNYIQLICDKVHSVLSDGSVYQRALGQDKAVEKVTIKLTDRHYIRAWFQDSDVIEVKF